MNPNEYQKQAESTSATATLDGQCQCISRMNGTMARLMHASAGFNTESGEFEDELKRAIFYGKQLDPVNLAEEVGDMLWYCAEACNALGISMADVMEKNISKLRERYPEKFTEHDALNRDLDNERRVLESGIDKVERAHDKAQEWLVSEDDGTPE